MLALLHAAALSFVLRTPCSTPCSTPARVAARAMVAEPGAMKLKEIKAELDELGVAWKGVCFEPQRQYHAEINRTRSCTLVPRCVLGDAQQQVAVSGHAGSMKVQALPSGGASGAADGTSMTCVVAGDILRSLDIKRIDLVNIDIEGSEPSVLRCFP